jgi:DNA repair protein RecO (recombination protein O)
MYINTSGLVIGRKEIGNADKLLTIYTLEFGKVKVAAAGARKTSARLMMATEPLVETEFMFFTHSSPLRRMKVIGGKLIDLFPILRTDLRRYTIACQVAEVVDMLTYEQIKNEKKYYLIRRTFQLIEDTAHPQRMYTAFLLRFLRLCGYGLQLDKCVMCLSDDTKYFKFSLKKSGLLCRNCSKTDSQAVDISGNMLTYFRNLGKFSGKDVDKIDVPEHMDKYIENYSNSYLLEYIRRPLKTREFARDMKINL